MDRPIRRSAGKCFRSEPAHLGETNFAGADQDFETTDSEQGVSVARRHFAGCYRRAFNPGNNSIAELLKRFPL